MRITTAQRLYPDQINASEKNRNPVNYFLEIPILHPEDETGERIDEAKILATLVEAIACNEYYDDPEAEKLSVALAAVTQAMTDLQANDDIHLCDSIDRVKASAKKIKEEISRLEEFVEYLDEEIERLEEN